jgi:hypothetical protein
MFYERISRQKPQTFMRAGQALDPSVEQQHQNNLLFKY